ncbi:hypothetical protein EGN72_03215 [Pseudorhodobacter sp. E13]|uniref:PP2C family protein-serine/threonine phosphatase n=1 Tax=Pseudorhodobacter sp. E13 TaxID=2487931 RepID=UPI000F8D24CF|nr:protein phosphatase 2C domain-containing protein [Pseudorhodobacter sp. E13]RUS63666.1 hypothetical protein EGN72_03215 [Pseudorhodobacter sp. E13]
MSSDIRRWPISDACQVQSARLGFDPDTPEQMIATRNAQAEQLLALIHGGQPQQKTGRSHLMIGVALAALMFVLPDTVNADVYAIPEKLNPPATLQFPPDPPVWQPLDLPETSNEEKESAEDGAPRDAIALPRVDPHPPLTIRTNPSAETAQPSWRPEVLISFPSLNEFFAALPQLLLAGVAWLIWRELRAIRREKHAETTEQEMQESKDGDMDDNISGEEQEDVRSPWRVTVGGASHCGQVRKENQDAYAVRDVADGIAFAATCDGVGGRPGGRTAARYCSRKLKSRVTMGLTVGLSAEQALLDALASCPNQMEEDGIEGLTTALLALVDGDRLTWTSLGDGRICIIHPDGVAQDLMAPHHAPNMPSNVITAHLEAGRTFTPRLGSMRVEPGSLIFTMSDGAGDLFNLHGLAARHKQIVEQIHKAGPEIFCDNLLSHLESLKDKETGQPLHSDNLTLTVMLVENEEAQA